MWKLKLSNGTCGRSVKTAVIRPVCGIGVDVADQLGVDPEAVGDQEDPVLVPRLRFTEVDRAFERAVERRRLEVDRADLRVVRAVRPGPRCRSSPAASGQARLAVGGVGVDRQAFRQGDGRLLDLRRREGVALELFRLQLQVEARGSIGFVGRQRRVEDRVEVEFLAAFDGREFVLAVRCVARVLVGDGAERHRQRFAGADRRVVDHRVVARCRPGMRPQLASSEPGAAGRRRPVSPLAKRSPLLAAGGREAPDRHFRSGQRDQLGQARDAEPEAVVRAGPHRDRGADRDL